MPGTTPPTSQLDWLISTTTMIVLSWSRATRDLLKSFGWGIRALHQLVQRRWCHFLAARPIPSRRLEQTEFELLVPPAMGPAFSVHQVTERAPRILVSKAALSPVEDRLGA